MKAVAALRVSTREQGDSGLGLEAQERAVRALAERLGAELVGIHRDVGVSGAAGLQHRPGLLAAVGALGKGDVLIVAKRDRLGRDPVNVAMIERLVERKGARVVSAAGEGTDDDSPTSVLMRRIVDAFAEYERLLISARTRAALKSKRERGERAGEVPFGWRALPSGKLFEDEGERAAIRLVVDARARGLSQRAIVVHLEEEGVRGRTGKPLRRNQVRRILAHAEASRG